MKKNIWITIITMSIIMLCLVPAQPVWGATTTFKCDEQKVKTKSNMPFSLNVKGEYITDLYGFEVVLSFDESQLEIVGKPQVKFAEGFFAGPTKATDDKVYFGFTKMGKKAGDNGAIDLAEFKFKAKEPGIYTIKLESVKVVDSKGNAKDFKVEQTIPIKVMDKGQNLEDIKGHWAESCISQVVDEAYMIGKTEILFKPNDKLTRAEMAMILNNILEEYNIVSNIVENKKVSTFEDINGDEWYAESIFKMADRGLLKGYEEGTFKPQQSITRAETLAILARIEKENGTYEELRGYEKILAPYKDADQVPAWVEVDVAWAIEKGLIRGDEKAKLNMQGNITRAEIAAILCRYLGLENHG